MNTNPSPNPTVFIIDDDSEIRNALKWLLESVRLNVECYESGVEFLDNYNPLARGCIVTDVRMPLLSGLHLLEKLNSAKNRLPIIIITGHGDIPMAVKAMKMGAIDFVSKPFNDQYLLEQIQKAIAKNAENSEEELEGTLSFDSLSAREKEIMDLIVQGKMNKQIAQELDISISTVEFHRSRVMKKMGSKNLAQLIKIYLSLQK